MHSLCDCASIENDLVAPFNKRAARLQISISYMTDEEMWYSEQRVSPKIVLALAKAVRCEDLEYLHVGRVVSALRRILISNLPCPSFVRSLLLIRLMLSQWNRSIMEFINCSESNFVEDAKPVRELGPQRI